MKQVLILIIITTTLVSYSSAQTGMDCTGMGAAEADIKVSDPTITPNPLMPPSEEGIGLMCFWVTNEINGIYTPDLLKMKIEFSGVIPNPDSTMIFSRTSSDTSSAWQWTYNPDSNCFLGLQVDTIPLDYYEEICMNVLVTAISPQTNKNNGFVAQLDIDSLACNASDQNDEILIYTYTSQEGAMPVTIVGFEGWAREHDNLLEWKIADNELLTSSVIERSFDGKNWQQIDEMMAEHQRGNILTQSTIDDYPGKMNYYRVRFDELDGSVTYTEILSIQRPETKIMLFPNPVYQNLFVEGLDLQQKELQILLTNTMGQEFHLTPSSKQLIKLDSNLSSGTYFLQIISADGKILYHDPIIISN